MSNTKRARPLNKTSGQRSRQKLRWNQAHSRFAPLGLTRREVAGILNSAAHGSMSTRVRDFLTGKKTEG